LAQGANPDEQDAGGRAALLHAAICNRLEVARLLLESGANVDAQDEWGNSSLHYAAQEHHIEMASILIERGAKVDIEDHHGNSPLWRAVFNSRGRGELVTLLLKAGADRNHRNKNGKSAIDLSRSIANYDVAQFFN
jgi:ankyrin repeat protein